MSKMRTLITTSNAEEEDLQASSTMPLMAATAPMIMMQM